MTDLNDKLLPCPFCGGTEAYVERLDYSAAYVQCDSDVGDGCSCQARGPIAVQDDDDEEVPGGAGAVRAWNQRATPAPQAAPSGWQLVPKELTPAMLDQFAAFDVFDVFKEAPSATVAVSKSMWECALRAAPAAPASLTPAPQGTASDWKLTADEMPPVDTPVLGFGVKRVGMAVMEHNERDGWQIATTSEWHGAHTPTHWMPLPAEPGAASLTQAATSGPVAWGAFFTTGAKAGMLRSFASTKESIDGFVTECNYHNEDEPTIALPLYTHAAPAAAQQAPSDEREAFEKSATYQGNADLTPAPEMTCENGWFPATYRSAATELAWRCYANKRALSAQQAGVQEAPRDERAAFEAWARSVGYDVSSFKAEDETAYSATFANVAFDAWQARAALSASSAVTNEDAKDAQQSEPADDGYCRSCKGDFCTAGPECVAAGLDSSPPIRCTASCDTGPCSDDTARDAARYRFLANSTWDQRAAWTWSGNKAECDAAVDAALASQGVKGGE